ncbi:MAG: phosphoribosylamine--glycine ligase [Candidatus Micrarchaeia archaeon]|jgi:phosphoribosylamine--glycine ligase
MTKVLLVGSGAREHAIAEAVCRSKNAQFFAFMGNNNPGIAALCKKHEGESAVGDIHEGKGIAAWAKERGIELAVIGPDAVLAAGVSNDLWDAGIPCAGPVKEAARLEWDKAFARSLMKKHAIAGCPEFGIFTEFKGASQLIDSLGRVAVKPSGLTGGKGVKVVGVQLKDTKEAKEYAREVLVSNIGKLGSVVIEEFLEGEEFTLQAFVDGEHVVGMPCVQDHKLAFEGDTGPNTGGMGAYTDAGNILPFMKKSDYDEALEIMKHTVKALKAEGLSYKGFLYGQFMITREGIKVVEFNSRLGDPEAMNVLAILKTDFVQLLSQMAQGTLSSAEFAQDATVCKYVVPSGYPDSPKADVEIEVDEAAIRKAGCHCYYAAVDEREGKIFTTSSRAVAVLGIAPTIAEAEQKAEKAVAFVKGEVAHRRDIGTAELIQKRVDHVQRMRG